tara:strand:+ start:148 stop:555 length:408 start_codon:yes stop_codon:yes gene_type:complete
MKKFINYLSVFTLVLFLSNCDNSTESESVHELVGQYVKIETILTIGSNVYNDYQDDNPKTLIFSGDGTYTGTKEIDGSIFNINGTWSTNEDKLTMIQDSVTNIFDYTIIDDTLTIGLTEVTDGVTQTVELIYQKQ